MRSLAVAFILAILAAGAWGLTHFVLANKGAVAVGQSPATTPPPVVAAADSIPEKSIAVLPFADLSEKHDQEYFSDGLSEELINQLTRISDLRVPGRTSSFYFKGKSEDIATIARALHVANVLEGSVRRSGRVMRVSAQLVRADSGYDVWSQTYDENVKDVFQVQDQIANAVVEALKAKLQLTLLQAKEAGSSDRTTNSEAHDAYLLGEQSLKRDSADSYKEAIRTFQRALQLDPRYAAAYAGLAEAEIRFSDYSSGERAALQRASEVADQAVMLAPNAPEGYVARSVIRGDFLWDWTGARADIERALALDPNNAHALADYAELLGKLGMLPQSLATARRAVDVDPLSGEAWETLGSILRNDGQFAAAREAILRTEQLKPQAIHSGNRLAEIELLEGHPEQAMAIAVRARFPEIMISLAAYTLGRQDESQHALDTLIRKYPDILAYQIAEAYAWRGEPEQAFVWLDRAYAQHDGGLASLKVDPLLFKLRSDPRYAALLAKMGLPS